MRHFLIFVFLLAGTLSGCSSEKDSSSEAATASRADSSQIVVQTFDGTGVVTSVMPNRKHVIIDHDDIPGFMSAMKMPFALRDTSLATGVHAGDSIRFTVEVDGPYIHLTSIDVTR